MKKQIFPILIVIFILTISYSCGKKKDSIIKTNGMEYFLGKLNVINDYSEENFDGRIDSLDTCLYNKAYIGLIFRTEYIEFHGGSPEVFADHIKSITITSNRNYNQTYPSGTNLSEQMLITYDEKGWYINDTMTYNNFIYFENICKHRLYLFFTEAPDSIRQHTFTIIYEEKEGSIYTEITYPIYLTL